MLTLVGLSLLISTTPIASSALSDEYVLGIVEWQYDCHPLVFNAGLVRVIDHDMNIDDDIPDKFDIEVRSDYDKNNIQKYVKPIHTVIETGNSTGIFEGEIFWGDPHDEGIGGRVPIWYNVTVTATYTDYTLPLSYLDSTLDITSSIIVKDVKLIEKNNLEGVSDFYYVYEPCTMELWDMKKDSRYAVEHQFIFPSPFKQIKSGIAIDEIQCKENLVLIQKYDGSSACVQPETIQKLIDRNWTTQLIVHDIVFKTMSKNLGPECEQTTMDDIISGIVDEKCSKFIDELANEQQLEMIQRGYSFDQEKKSWVKDGYPDTMMSIADYYQQNLKIVESEPTTIEELLVQNQIDYLPAKLIVTSGPVIRGDPGCGAVIGSDSTTHWFGIDSISEPKEITLFSENPNQCEVNTTSCFCNAQMELSSLTLDELNYFTLEEQEKFAKILIDYLSDENINRTPKFHIGKLNINYTDSSAIGYCGEIWGKNTYGFFDGAIVNDVVMDYGISKELPLLCAISDDVKWWERK